MSSRDFTLTCLPQPAQLLPTPLIFAFTPSEATFFYILLEWGKTIMSSLVAGPYNLRHSTAVIKASRGRMLGAMRLADVDEKNIFFLCSNGSWIPGFLVFPNSAISYFVGPADLRETFITTTYRDPVDMTPANRVLEHLSCGDGKNSTAGYARIDVPMPANIISQIPGYTSNGFFFRPSDFDALLSRKTVTFPQSLFERVRKPEVDHAFRPLKLDSDIASLVLHTMPSSWNSKSRTIREMLEDEDVERLPTIVAILEFTSVLGNDHVFKVMCSIDEGKTVFEAHILLSMVRTAARRLGRDNRDDPTIHALMSMLYGPDWMAVEERMATVAKKYEQQRRANEAAVNKMEDGTGIDDDVNASALRLAEKIEDVSLARTLGPNQTYDLSVEEQARRLVDKELAEERLEQQRLAGGNDIDDDDRPVRRPKRSKKTAKANGADLY